MQSHWRLDEYEWAKDPTLSEAAKKWNQWKSSLSRDFIVEDVSLTEVPPMYEMYISQEEWNQFREHRTSVEMMNSRKKHQQIQSKNKHSHSLGRAGYIGKEQEMVSVCCNLLLYNYLHLMSKNEDTLTQKVVMGEFHPQGKKDTLSEALGSEEHRGRVRGLGKGYTWGNFWGSSATRGTIPISAFEQYKQEMNQSMQMLHDRLSRFEQTHSGRASCDAPRPPVYMDEPVESTFTPQPGRWSEEVI
ncbi:hypothetical protein UlMin_024734 [Ulmus minor]